MIPNNVFALWLRASAIVLACCLTTSADEPAHFLSHGPGAKSLAMGESFTAVADDPSAIYWNPAGILAQPPSVLMEHTPTLSGGRLNFLSGVASSKKIAAGFGVYQYATDDVEARAAVGDGPTAISVSQTAYFLPIAFTTPLADMGVNFKLVENHFGSYRNVAQGADVGFLKVAPLRKRSWVGHPILGVGFTARNLVPPTFKTNGGDPETFPREYALGATLEGQFRRVFNVIENTRVSDSARLTLENVATSDQWVSVRVGGEYLYRHVLSVRAGWNDRLTAGVGVWLLGQALTVDYALAFADLELEHKMSLTYRFLPKRKKSKRGFPVAPKRDGTVVPDHYKIPAPQTPTKADPATPPLGNNGDTPEINSDDAPFENPFRWNLAVFPPIERPTRKPPK